MTDEGRERIIDLVVWNQQMEGIASSRERVAARYDRAMSQPLTIPDAQRDRPAPPPAPPKEETP